MRLLSNDASRKTARFLKFRRKSKPEDLPQISSATKAEASENQAPNSAISELLMDSPEGSFSTINVPPTDAPPFKMAAMPAAKAASTNDRIAPCKCMLKDNKWFCMKPDKTGRYLMVDGPFDTESECLSLAVCE